MAHKKSAGTTKNGRDSNPKYLGMKVNPGQKAQAGSVLLRQRGTVMLPGKNVSMGKDHTLFATKEGTVGITSRRKVNFNKTVSIKQILEVK